MNKMGPAESFVTKRYGIGMGARFPCLLLWWGVHKVTVGFYSPRKKGLKRLSWWLNHQDYRKSLCYDGFDWFLGIVTPYDLPPAAHGED